MKYTVEAPDIYSFPLFSPEFCRETVRRLRRSPGWRPSGVVGPLEGRVRRSTEIRLRNVPSLHRRYRAATGFINPLTAFCWGYDVTRHHSFKVLRYRKGGYYRDHCDYTLPLTPIRLISLVCYLNDDFEGGETAFSRQKCVVKPRAGKAVVFPSGITHPHSAEPVRSGTKYVLVGWIC